MDCWAIVPVKSFADAKRRLLGALGDNRAALARLTAARVFAALAGASRVDRLLVVTSDPEAARLANGLGAAVLADPDDGLNAAVRGGIAHARAQGADDIMIVHSDLPELTARAVDDLLARYRDLPDAASGRPVGMVPCKHAEGTNVLILPADADFRPQFGEGSFDRHLRAAGARGRELLCEQAARDIDTPADFIAFTARIGAPDEAGLEDRIALARRWLDEGEILDTAALIAIPGAQLAETAARIRARTRSPLVTYSRKLFLPLTQLCRDVCHYCTFAQSPRRLDKIFMSADEVVAIARKGAEMGCKEALFTLGEKPELRYREAREWLDAHGFASTLDYVAHAARRVRDETGLLPHINAGCMDAQEIAMLRPVSASMGLMLESAAERLCEKGGPHHGSPDKHPAARLATIAEAGRQNVPFTTGLLVGIGETRAERIEALEAIRALHEEYGHIQELIIQNFAPKPGTKMADAPPAPLDELVWTIAVARMMFGPQMPIQAPPNLSIDAMEALVAAGIDDWGGVSPLTPDFVNPEAPWPEIERLRQATESAGKTLAERLTIYPRFVREADRWLDPAMRQKVRELADGQGLGRENRWLSGRSGSLPDGFHLVHRDQPRPTRIAQIVQRVLDEGSQALSLDEMAALFAARGSDYALVCEAADELRRQACGDVATFVVNRNINYTNICSYRCGFCAFSKGTRKHEGAEKPYLLDSEEISRRVAEAAEKGGTEVCLQGGIHPNYTGETYLDILRAVRRADPAMHVHAFSPLEVWHGAATLDMALADYLRLLKAEGLGSLPGTAAEILHDPVRRQICPDKLSAFEWIEVIEAAHGAGLPTTATIMFGHVDDYRDWAIHLRRLRDLQIRTGGITEFVPLGFVAHEAPLYKRGAARPGPTLREAVLMHAVARLILHPHIGNVQASWVKMGRGGMIEALRSGANDLGGTLMNESITRAAGATHGQEMSAGDLCALARQIGRVPRRRTTLYGVADALERSGRGLVDPGKEKAMPERQSPHSDKEMIDDLTEGGGSGQQGRAGGDIARKVGTRASLKAAEGNAAEVERARGSDNPEADAKKGPKTLSRMQGGG